MRSASTADFSTSFPRVRTPAVIALARDLKTLIVLLVCLAKWLGDHGCNNTRHATMKQNRKWYTNIPRLTKTTTARIQELEHNSNIAKGDEHHAKETLQGHD